MMDFLDKAGNDYSTFYALFSFFGGTRILMQGSGPNA
jgi:hypothetical protein